MSKEVLEGPTPAGGILSEIYYFDSEMQSIDKGKATYAITRELDSKGNLILETRANLK
jgi:hypothetical protein